ncbi:MAG: hypothetical protein IT175_16750 [Acidobacteria bacterium]|nr:hypothetical protein [Acidobacteriota bacterium]
MSRQKRLRPCVLLHLAIAVVGLVCALPHFAAASSEGPSDATSGVPVRDDGLAAVLTDSIGGIAASSAAGKPGARAAVVAQTLPVRASAGRSYGRVRVSAFKLVNEPIAYAMLRFAQPEGATPAELGDDGWTSANESAVRIGDVVVFVTGGSAIERATIASAVAATVTRVAPNAPIVDNLPSAGRIPATERYVSSHELLMRLRPDLVEDVYRLGSGGADAAIADYAQADAPPARLLIVEYQTPQLATEAQQSVAAWYERLDQSEQASRLLKREGNFLIEATGVASVDGFRPTVDAVKYDYKITMLDGPMPAVQLDTAREAYTTAMLLIGSVRLVGAGALIALVLGMAVGAFVFARRRRAAANVFSDAGGMVHLELDGAVRALEPGRENRGLLGEGSESSG